MTSFIQTVRGPIHPEVLGTTLMHEHLVLDYARARYDMPPLASRYIANRIVACLDRALDIGVDSVVDVTPDALSPSPMVLALVAERTKMNIVCATGVYAADVTPPPRWAFQPAGPREVADHFIEAAKEGLAGSGVKPGIIKVATSGRAIGAVEEVILRGAALAQRETGLAITTHTEFTRFTEQQVDIFADAGADLNRVIIGHIGWGTGAADLDLHKRLAMRGVTLGLDIVGSPIRSLDEWARMVVDLLDAGYVSNVVLSHDQTAYSRGLAVLPGYDGQWYTGDYTAVHTGLLPILRQMGVEDGMIRELTCENPRRLLTVDTLQYPDAEQTLLWQPADDDIRVSGDSDVVYPTEKVGRFHAESST